MSFKPLGPYREAERGSRKKDKWSMFFPPPSLCGRGGSGQTGCGCNSCWAEGFVWWKQQSAAKEDCFAALLQADLKLSLNASDDSWIIDWPTMSVSFCCVSGGLYHPTHSRMGADILILNVTCLQLALSVCQMGDIWASWVSNNFQNILWMAFDFYYLHFLIFCIPKTRVSLSFTIRLFLNGYLLLT